MIFEHSGPVQILAGDDIEMVDEIGRELMQRLGPDIRNPGLEPGDAPLGFPCAPPRGCAGLPEWARTFAASIGRLKCRDNRRRCFKAVAEAFGPATFSPVERVTNADTPNPRQPPLGFRDGHSGDQEFDGDTQEPPVGGAFQYLPGEP
jgi:hypothetical protein